MSEIAEHGKFEGWAMVEMMGHRKEIGYVTTQAFGQAVLFRVDTPELLEREYELDRPQYVDGIYSPTGTVVKRPAIPARSCLIAPGSIYAINPCTEDLARHAIEKTFTPPLILVRLPETKSLPASVLEEDEEYEDASAGDVLEIPE